MRACAYLLFLPAALPTSLLPPSMGAERLVYPPTHRMAHTDTYHGKVVADPYRWLEEDVRQSPRVNDWVQAQSRLTRQVLDAMPQREAIRRRLEQLWNYPRYTTPMLVGERLFFERNDGLQNQSVLCILDRGDAQDRVLIDPNTWSSDGSVALAGYVPNRDGRYLAYAVAEAGSDWKTWRVMEVEGGRLLDDEIRWTKFGAPVWGHDSRGFYYGRFDPPAAGQEFQSVNLNHKLFYHRLGDDPSVDELVYHRPDEPTWGFWPTVTDDGRYLIVLVSKGTDDKYRVLYRDLSRPGDPMTELIDNFDHEYTPVGNDGPMVYFKTTLDAPMGRVIAIDAREPRRVRSIIPEMDAALNRVSLIGDQFIATYLKDARAQVSVFDRAGQFLHEVPLPATGSISGFGGRREARETYYTFLSFTTPPTSYRYDLASRASAVFRQSSVAFDPDPFEVRQVFYSSADGTRIPMFLAHRKGLTLDGSNPTLLYGYGGFGVSQTPRFWVSNLVWMEMGGVLAVPNIRGGGEYGERWHEAAVKVRKQTSYDDFIAAAQWLIDQRYTRPDRLAIQGGSNGGLLVGAVITQRPDLFGAALPSVPVTDMLRFHLFTAGRYWVDDFGSPENPEEFKALLAYSPYHNVRAGTQYPATLISTADTDDRVVPGHSFKFAAALQHAQAGEAPILLRIESRAGHGAGTSTSKLIDRLADEWAFLVQHLRIDVTW